MNRRMIMPALLAAAALASCEDSATSDEPSPAAAAPSHLPDVSETHTMLAPATYQFSFHAIADTPEALLDVPAGYETDAPWFVVSHDGGEYLGLWTVGYVDRDACAHGETDSYPPGTSVQNLADALVAQASTRATKPRPVTLDGYDGLYLEIHGPKHMATCADEEAGLWSEPGGRGIYSDGQVDLVWILDVDGQRLVVDGAYSAGSTAAEIAAVRAMAESVRFVEG